MLKLSRELRYGPAGRSLSGALVFGFKEADYASQPWVDALIASVSQLELCDERCPAGSSKTLPRFGAALTRRKRRVCSSASSERGEDLVGLPGRKPGELLARCQPYRYVGEFPASPDQNSGCPRATALLHKRCQFLRSPRRHAHQPSYPFNLGLTCMRCRLQINIWLT